MALLTFDRHTQLKLEEVNLRHQETRIGVFDLLLDFTELTFLHFCSDFVEKNSSTQYSCCVYFLANSVYLAYFAKEIPPSFTCQN